MGTNTEHFEALSRAVNGLHEQIANLENEARAAAEEAAAGTLGRLEEVVGSVRALIVQTPPAMVTEAMITAIEPHVGAIAAQLPQLETDAASAVASIDASLEAVVASTAGWATLPPIGGDKGQAIARTVLKHVEQKVDDLARRFGGLSEELTRTESTQNGRLAELDTAIADSTGTLEKAAEAVQSKLTAQDQAITALQLRTETEAAAQRQGLAEAFKAAQDEREHQFEELQAQLKESSDAQIEQLRHQATAQLEAMEPEFTKLQTAITAEKQRLDALAGQQQQQFDSLKEAWSTRVEAQSEDAETKASKTLAKMQAILEQAQLVANAIASTGTATAYGQDAKDERKMANRWRLGAIGLGLIAALVAGFTLIWRPFESGPLSSQAVIGRILVSLAVGALASYAGRESGKHRNREVRSRQLELELTAFPPFIEGLDEATKEKLRVEFVARLFKGADGQEDRDQEAVIGPEQVTLFGNLMNMFTKVLQAK
jgi:DNA repair exonuclease SbcCD ATPase subunit